jgi:hypothetical protein
MTPQMRHFLGSVVYGDFGDLDRNDMPDLLCLRALIAHFRVFMPPTSRFVFCMEWVLK